MVGLSLLIHDYTSLNSYSKEVDIISRPCRNFNSNLNICAKTLKRTAYTPKYRWWDSGAELELDTIQPPKISVGSTFHWKLGCFDVRHLFLRFFRLMAGLPKLGYCQTSTNYWWSKEGGGKYRNQVKATKGQMGWSIWFYEHSKHLLPQNCLDRLPRLSQRTVYSFPWFHFKVHWI